MPFIEGYNFILGTNQGWFSGQYDHDLGHNQFSIGRLYKTSLNFIQPDISPLTPYLSTLNSTQFQNEIGKIFSDITNEENFSKIVRVWVFERFEGLKFDNSGKIVGIDDDFLINLVKVLDLANNYDVKIYLCLIDTWSIYQPPPTDIVTPDKTQQYYELRETWQYLMRNLIFEEDKLQSFFSNALDPLLKKINDHQALFAIDLLNEPEGMIKNDPFIDIVKVRNFIRKCSEFIHENYNNVKVSCGFQKTSTATLTEQFFAETQNQTILDFIDFHEYNTTGTLKKYSSLKFKKPCLVGECGYTESELGNLNNQDKIVEVMENFLTNAESGEYAGALPWVEKYPKKQTMLEKIRSYKSSITLIHPNESKKKKGCFIATAALGSELHPDVQFIRKYRDSVILRSKYRNQFAKLLDFYYWFSPSIAEYIKKNKFSKILVRYLVVYPFLKILKILIKIFDSNFKS